MIDLSTNESIRHILIHVVSTSQSDTNLSVVLQLFSVIIRHKLITTLLCQRYDWILLSYPQLDTNL